MFGMIKMLPLLLIIGGAGFGYHKVVVNEKDNEEFIYKGLSGKCFTKVFRVGDNVQVKKAYMERGLLCVDLEDVTPEEDLPKNIPIT